VSEDTTKMLKLGEEWIEIGVTADTGCSVYVKPFTTVNKCDIGSSIEDLTAHDQLWSAQDIADQLLVLQNMKSGTALYFETRYLGDRGNGLVTGDDWAQKSRTSSRVASLGTLA